MEQFVVNKNGVPVDNMVFFKNAKVSFTSQRSNAKTTAEAKEKN